MHQVVSVSVPADHLLREPDCRSQPGPWVAKLADRSQQSSCLCHKVSCRARSCRRPTGIHWTEVSPDPLLTASRIMGGADSSSAAAQAEARVRPNRRRSSAPLGLPGLAQLPPRPRAPPPLRLRQAQARSLSTHSSWLYSHPIPPLPPTPPFDPLGPPPRISQRHSLDLLSRSSPSRLPSSHPPSCAPVSPWMHLPTAAAWAALLSTTLLLCPAAAASSSASLTPATSNSTAHGGLTGVHGHYAVQHQLGKDALALGIAQPAVGGRAGGARRRRRRVGGKRDSRKEKVRGVSESGRVEGSGRG